MLEAAKQSVPQEHSRTPSPFSLDLGTTVFLDQLKVDRQDYEQTTTPTPTPKLYCLNAKNIFRSLGVDPEPVPRVKTVGTLYVQDLLYTTHSSLGSRA